MLTTERGRLLLAGGLLALATLVVFHPLTRHPTDLLVGSHPQGLNDVTTQFLSYRDFPAANYRVDGELPTWNRFGLFGAPWLGNPQSALIYPGHWLFAVAPAAWAISWLVVAHHFWAGLGAYALARRLGADGSSAIVSGVVFLAAPFLLAQTGEGHATQVMLVAWTPWAFVAYERFRGRERYGFAALACILAVCFFCGHVQECFYLVVILTLFLAADLVYPRESGAGRVELARGWIVLGLIVIGLVATELLPNAIYTRQAVRAEGITAAEAGRISMGFANAIQLVDPLALGGAEDYRGPGGYFWETLCYFGVAPLGLAIACLALRGGDRAVRGWALVVLGTLLFSLGADTPLFAVLHRWVPGFSLFRSPSRALFFTSLAVAVLAGLGVQGVVAAVRDGQARNSRFAAAALLAAAVAGVCVAIAQPQLPGAWGQVDLVKTLVLFSAASLSVGLLVSLVAVNRSPAWAIAAIAAVCLVDFSLLSARLLNTVPQVGVRRDSELVQALLADPNRQRVLAPQQLLSDREAWSRGVEKVRRYEPVPLTRAVSMIVGLAPRANPETELTGFSDLRPAAYRKQLLDLCGVTHMVVESSEPQPIPGWEIVQRGFVPAEFTVRGGEADRRPYVLYRNTAAMPRAFVVGDAQILTGGHAKALGDLQPRREVLVEHDVLPAGPRSEYRTARVTSRTGEHVAIEAELDRPGYLVLTDMYYSGWTATVDGKDSPIHSANVAFRAIALDAGSHRVEFTYRPAGFQIGAIVTALTLVGLLFSSSRSAPRPAANPTPAATPSPELAARLNPSRSTT
jgi:hypothetical protein